jgi:hypothetical protein
MEEFRGLTAEMYQAIVAIIDDRLREVRVAREGFDQLTQAISRLTQAQGRTAPTAASPDKSRSTSRLPTLISPNSLPCPGLADGRQLTADM